MRRYLHAEELRPGYRQRKGTRGQGPGQIRIEELNFVNVTSNLSTLLREYAAGPLKDVLTVKIGQFFKISPNISSGFIFIIFPEFRNNFCKIHQRYMNFLAIFRNEITTILTPSTTEGG